MSFKNKYINIIDWAGNNLLNAEYDSPEVDRVLELNRCKGCDDETGYSGDFDISWEDESDKSDCNVYEYINY